MARLLDESRSVNSSLAKPDVPETLPRRDGTRDYGGMNMGTNVETMSEVVAIRRQSLDSDSDREAGLSDRLAEPRKLEAGALLQDTYRIDYLIAAGGMGEVYRATHERLEGAFAIKVLHHELLRDEGLLARFETEAKIMASLRHPHIVQVFDFNYTPSGIPYLVMELAEGPDLRTIMTEQRVLAPKRVAQIVEQTAGALSAAHARGVIHRDLKPENIMLVPIEGQGDCVKVVDFGISKASRQPVVTLRATVLGTPEYMSPEQAQGLNDDIDHRTDQFALGVLAYMLLSGSEPFRGQTPVSVLYQVVHEQPTALGELVDWPCPRIEAVLRKAMAKNRDDRYPNILDFARAFSEAVAADLGGGRETTRAPSIGTSSEATPESAPKPQAGLPHHAPPWAAAIDADLATTPDRRPLAEGGDPLHGLHRPLRMEEHAPVASRIRPQRMGAPRFSGSPNAQLSRRPRHSQAAPRRPAHPRRPPQPQRGWRLAAMAVGAACVAAATLAFGASGQPGGRFAFTNASVISVYDALSTSATRFLHLGSKLKMPESAAE